VSQCIAASWRIRRCREDPVFGVHRAMNRPGKGRIAGAEQGWENTLVQVVMT
jgi:hypothetical protein